MALYGPALKKLIPPGPTDPPITARTLILHVAVSETASLYDYFNGPSGGVESHFYIRRDGTVEQYRDTSTQADANTDANGFAISVETQGMERGEWTPAQLDAIKALTLWCHDTHGIPLEVPTKWDGSGVGYHTLFPGSWDKRGASCPGPDRKVQFDNIIRPWLTTAAAPKEWDEMASKQEIKDALIEVLQQDGLVKAPIASNPTVAPVTALSYAMQWSLAARNAAQVAANGADVTAEEIAAAIPDALAQQVVDALANRLTTPES